MNSPMVKRSYFGTAVFFACLAILFFLGTVVFGWLNPTVDPPGGSGAIAVDSSGNIGIGITPTTKLDVNGTTKFRGLIDAFSNRIINLASPTAGTDAVNKNYVDSQTGGQNSQRVWGEGRPNSAVETVGGDCVVAGVKISRSFHTAQWDSAAAACPAGWWVCSVADRGNVACGTGNRDFLNCSGVSGSTGQFWVADGDTVNRAKGLMVNYPGTAVNAQEMCESRKVWCCAN